MRRVTPLFLQNLEWKISLGLLAVGVPPGPATFDVMAGIDLDTHDTSDGPGPCVL